MRKIGEFRGDNLVQRFLRKIFVLPKPLRLTEEDEYRFKGLILKEASKVQIGFGICIEAADYSLRGEKLSCILFVLLMSM